jgi:UDP-3-O-[3-hydroxymyristoyl] glucosamine N-acyltransferase
MLTFAENEAALRQLARDTTATAVLTTRELARSFNPQLGVAISDSPRRDFFLLQNALVERTAFYGRRFVCAVHPEARVHPRAIVAEQDVCIGPGVLVEPSAVIGAGTRIASGAIVRAGAVIGGAGFQTYRGADRFIEMLHGGTVEIGEGAHVMSNATVARGVFRQTTQIGAETRIGNNVFVSHNVWIGERSFIGHGSVINGNTQIGARVWVGPGAVLANGVLIGDNARLSLGAVVVSDVPPGDHVSGNFAVGHKRLLRHLTTLR